MSIESVKWHGRGNRVCRTVLPAVWFRSGRVKTGVFSPAEIHRLLKTAVEKPMFARKYISNSLLYSFSTLLFHSLWIIAGEKVPEPHPIYGTAYRIRTKDGGNCSFCRQYFSTSKIYKTISPPDAVRHVENNVDKRGEDRIAADPCRTEHAAGQTAIGPWKHCLCSSPYAIRQKIKPRRVNLCANFSDKIWYTVE